MLNCNRQFAADISLENELYRLEIYVIEGTCVKKKLTKPSHSLQNGSLSFPRVFTTIAESGLKLNEKKCTLKSVSLKYATLER